MRDKNISFQRKFMFLRKDRGGSVYETYTEIRKLVLAVLNGQFRRSTGLVRICTPYLFDSWPTLEPLEPLNAPPLLGPRRTIDARGREGEFFSPPVATCGVKSETFRNRSTRNGNRMYARERDQTIQVDPRIFYREICKIFRLIFWWGGIWNSFRWNRESFCVKFLL